MFFCGSLLMMLCCFICCEPEKYVKQSELPVIQDSMPII